MCAPVYPLGGPFHGQNGPSKKIIKIFQGQTDIILVDIFGIITHRCHKQEFLFRYHAAVETGEQLIRCLVYIDLNMVCAGVVKYPSEWPHGGYREILNQTRPGDIR